MMTLLQCKQAARWL